MDDRFTRNAVERGASPLRDAPVRETVTTNIGALTDAVLELTELLDAHAAQLSPIMLPEEAMPVTTTRDGAKAALPTSHVSVQLADLAGRVRVLISVVRNIRSRLDL